MKPSPLTVLLLSSIGLLLLAVASSADQVIFEDGEFPDWSYEFLAIRGNGEMLPDATGGNPGACLRAITAVEPPYGFVYLCMWKESAIWHPAAGEVTSMALRIDTRGVVTHADGQALWLLLVQDGTHFGGPVAQHVTGSSTTWHTMQLGPITTDDFFAPCHPMRFPDFSPAGSPMRLGFIVANSATGSPYSHTHLYDNWRVTIDFLGTTAVEATTWGSIKRCYR